MENEQQNISQVARKDVTVEGNTSSFLNDFKSIRLLCEDLKDSTAAKIFWQSVTVKDENGKDKRDENDNLITKQVFNVADMIMCIGIGNQLGFNPMTSLSFGKLLDIDAIQKIETGKSIGLNPIDALNNIYIFNAGGRKITYVAYNIISGLLTRNGISIEIIKDGRKARPQYRSLINNEIIYELTNNHVNISVFVGNDELLNNAKLKTINENKIPIICTQLNYEAEIKFGRYNKVLDKVVENTFCYDSQQAIDAGLLAGIKTDNTTSSGKDNWNNYRASNLRKMIIMEASRTIYADITHGLYIPEELENINDK